MRKSAGMRMAHWRACVLVAVHLLIVAHLLHGWWAGETFGRVVLADAQTTLERGVINPGFLLFALALLVTALCGRFFCGWACHMGALQDLCTWLLRRMHIRPRLFRSRLLGYWPLLLALYLFVWPSFERAVLLLWSGLPQTGAATFAGWSLQLRSNDLWAGMPTLWVAIPFLLICSGATVYFLGARGLCRYACPYGGLLRPAEQLAPVRVVVDPDRCDHCALCTAACSMQIRVHEHTQKFGAVWDADCMRTLDCVEACPQQALSLSPVIPPLWRGTALPARGYSLGLFDELLVAAMTLGVCWLSRGLYGQIPLLLAATLGVLSGFLCWKTLQMLRDPQVRLHALVLRHRRQLTAAGRIYMALITVGVLLGLQAGAVRFSLWQADRLDQQVNVPWQDILPTSSRAIAPEQTELAARALVWYQRAQPIGQGGLAPLQTPEIPLRMAWMHLVLGDFGAAEDQLRQELTRLDGDEIVLVELARVLLLQGRIADATRLLDEHWQARPTLISAATLLIDISNSQGQTARAEQIRARTSAELTRSRR